MALNETTPESRDFVPAPKFFNTMGCQDAIPIKQFLRYIQLVNNAVNRADRQNQFKPFELIGEEASAFACFRFSYGPGSRRGTKAKAESVHMIQTENRDAANCVSTQIDDTVPAQNIVGKDLSAIRGGVCVEPLCGQTATWESAEVAEKPSETMTSDSSEMACQPKGFAATARLDQHVGNSACTDIIQAASTTDVPACSTSGFGRNSPGDSSRLSHLDSMARQALADANLPKHPPPEQAVAATPGRKVNRSLHAQPDFNYVQHEFDANSMSLKKLWHQYRQSHPNKRTYEYSQFCNRFNDWIASQASTALSQGP